LCIEGLESRIIVQLLLKLLARFHLSLLLVNAPMAGIQITSLLDIEGVIKAYSQ